MEYFDGFEIIDNEFSEFIQKKFNNIILTFVTFSKINDKFFFVFNNNGEKYQIGSINSLNILTFEYLINIIVIKIEPNKGSYKDYIFNILIKQGTKLFSQGNSFTFVEEGNELFFSSKNDPLIYISENKNTILPRKESSDLDEKSSNSSFDYSPSNKMVNFVFMTQREKRIEIQMEYDKNINELIKLYFKTLNRIDLLNDKSIGFLYAGEALYHNSELLIKDIFQKDLRKKNIHITVFDSEDKISPF